ncbi:GSCFA domain-containing protein [Alloyangia pacifica]|uniref:GSCFA family protein n=1 Tax=Alloyangia pacifica TaxID=311180 RepID=A0A1I6RKX1_9RHOB|nr:GSCFA domain-containing protein [Alloyangia pacifica]SDI69687.1 GSCFA family protein [Alloyangia pacifica]SFS65357.1 GSCFA family protein [Alloyangia pacifica]
MSNPYESLPDQNFWKTGVFAARDAIEPRVSKVFHIAPSDRIMTAGSCFAQNVALHLRKRDDISFYTAEPLREGEPVFSARYGNIYTAHQLLQIFDECMSGDVDPECAIRRRDGRFVDINRPYMEKDGFARAQDVLEARRSHLEAVRLAFSQADILIFTLGLTEAWVSPGGDRVFPICPGVYSDDAARAFEFKNYSFSEIRQAMESFLEKLTALNPHVKVLLTVSPVPLTATYTEDHVLVATMHSKSVLRVICSEMVQAHDAVFYFPSYEMISNAYVGATAYAPENLREVDPAAIEKVMTFFEKLYLDEGSGTRGAADPFGEAAEAICEDVEIERSVGF